MLPFSCCHPHTAILTLLFHQLLMGRGVLQASCYHLHATVSMLFSPCYHSPATLLMLQLVYYHLHGMISSNYCPMLLFCVGVALDICLLNIKNNEDLLWPCHIGTMLVVLFLQENLVCDFVLLAMTSKRLFSGSYLSFFLFSIVLLSLFLTIQLLLFMAVLKLQCCWKFFNVAIF